ncbi:MAG: shikimate dehydrogenase [Gammaproteobacteria bacterium]|nr:shikimate dehydrogenase [Gammaproteobacteria bacterium]
MAGRYAVMGNPIAHSKSPEIHRAFAAQTSQAMEYERILSEPTDFETDVQHFFDTGGQGLNVTVPFKERAWAMADECTSRARVAGAVNTLIPMAENGCLRGDNTDGVGLVRDLTVNHGFLLSGSRLLLIGAGGAARGTVGPLLETGPESLTIANRSPGRAEALAAVLAEPERVRGCGLDELNGCRFDLIINATAAGLGGELPDIPDGILAPGGWVYDMMYGSEPTVMVLWGQSQEATQSLDGLGMLVEQAAESFFLWRGVRPDTRPVISSLRTG